MAIAERTETIRATGRRGILAAVCCIAFALSVDPMLWMMGLDIPTRAFGAGGEEDRVFSTTSPPSNRPRGAHE